MGSGISKSMKVDPDIKYKEPKKLPSGFNSKRLDERELLDVVSGMFDAHAHLVDFKQSSDGIQELLGMMNAYGVVKCALTGCPLKKRWSDFEKRAAEDVWNDTDPMVYFSLTDGVTIRSIETLSSEDAKRFLPMMCGFDPTDRMSAQYVTEMYHYDDALMDVRWAGVGEIVVRGGLITNQTSGPIVSMSSMAFTEIATLCESLGLPLVVRHNAGSESTKKYKDDFEYIPELQKLLADFPNLRVLWVGGGIFNLGTWEDYEVKLAELLQTYSNLTISVSAEVIEWNSIPMPKLVEIAEKFPQQFVVGTSTRGEFISKYASDIRLIGSFLRCLSPFTASRVRYANAAKLFELSAPENQKEVMQKVTTGIQKGRVKEQDSRAASLKSVIVQRSESLHDTEKEKKLDSMPVTAKNKSLSGGEKAPWCIYDCHLHFLDFLQKSSGSSSVIEAMDGCGVGKAVWFGMPCCKKWAMSEPEQPLYYLDDNGACYCYAYGDQMIADAWLALGPAERRRCAPMYSSFNPVDLNGIAHVRRMYQKYPQMWRGLGEVMCRHDDLTSMLEDKETPACNHPGLKAVYQWACEVNLPVLVHHNADRIAERIDDGEWEYLNEVCEVLEMFPKLKFTWVHCGVSRRCAEETHYQMCDDMCDKYPGLKFDISWVVWEDVICKPDGSVKPEWMKVFAKHSTRFMIGSDQVGQFIGPNGENWLKPEIVKYYKLLDNLPKEAADNIAWRNAENEYFKDWNPPSDGRYAKLDPTYDCECLYNYQGMFVKTGEKY